jgi:2-oxoglutarate ferredoxin oxidoreductase subunit beta
MGKKTKTTPLGSIDRPFNPLALALGAGATFAARTVDTDVPHLQSVLARAAQHKGTAFVEILQNCIVFNDGAYETLTDKASRADARVLLEHGKPMVYGTQRNRGIRMRGMQAEAVTLGEDGVTEADLLVHDEKADHSALAFLLAQLGGPAVPIALGVFRAMETPTYQERNGRQVADARHAKGRGDLASLLGSGDTWIIE